MPLFLSRRQFLKVSVGTVACYAIADKVIALTTLQPVNGLNLFKGGAS
jgi:nitrate reductase alpha subunit